MKDIFKIDFKLCFFKILPLIFIIAFCIYGSFIGYNARLFAGYYNDYSMGVASSMGMLILVSIVYIIFYSIFVNKDYKNNTIRNKVIAGHTRINIYFSKVIVGILYGIYFYFSFIISAIISCLLFKAWDANVLTGFINMSICLISLIIFNVGLIILVSGNSKSEFGMVYPALIIFVLFVMFFIMEMMDSIPTSVYNLFPFTVLYSGFDSGNLDVEGFSVLNSSLMLCAEGIIMIIVGYLIFRKNDLN